MRLTLRTLLAWLDDTLPPAGVREIGRQVSESQFAQDLKEKIARVTRQRRLTVPPSSGPDAVEASLVAAYIDNELSPEEVTEYEKKCLTSDVHLAEVASVHQILSGIGQKAKVPHEARERMYHLIKGRESVGADVPRAFAPPKPDPLTEPLESWSPQELPRGRPWLEQLGPGVAVLGLILLLAWLVWSNLSQPQHPAVALIGPVGGPQMEAIPGQGAAPLAAPQAKAAPKPQNEPAPQAKGETPGPDANASMDETPPQGNEEKTPEPPAGAVALTGTSEGVLLRYNDDPKVRDWKRLAPQTPLKEGDRLLSLDPYRHPIQFGAARVLLMPGTEVRVHRPAAGQAARLDLIRGRLILQEAEPPVAVGFADGVLTLTPPPGGVLGLERAEQRRPGEPALPAILRIFVPEGDAVVASPAGSRPVSGPRVLVFQTAPAKLSEPEAQDIPGWVTDPDPSPAEGQAGELFAAYFKTGQEPLASLVEASEDPNNEVSRLAVAALGAIGNIELVIPLASTPNRPATRRAAIVTLRSALAQSPSALKDVQALLEQTWGPEVAATLQKLLVGYTGQEAQDNATYATLVRELSSDDVGIRELAIDNLQTLTGRDRLGYDPDNPEERRLQAWQDLLRERLQPADAAPQAK
jgi:hypothetical protein